METVVSIIGDLILLVAILIVANDRRKVWEHISDLWGNSQKLWTEKVQKLRP